MRQTTTATLALAGLLVAGSRAWGEDAPPTTVPAPKMEEQTQIEGTAPEIEGRWLVLATVGIAQGAKRTVVSIWEVTRKDGKLDLHERLIVLPTVQNAALAKGNDEAGGVWNPTPADLAAISAAWDTLTPEDRGINHMVHQVTGRDGYDDDLKKDALSKDALWVVRQLYVFEPGGGHPINQANLIAPSKFENGIYSGGYLAVAVAAAPFPIPIKFEGTFRLIPLAPPGGDARSLWSRIGDFFAGCGAR